VKYEFSWGPFAIFILFVGSVLAISFYLASKAKSAKGYYAAHGQIGWFVNGVAFAGDYLSAASFLGICGLIAFYGYDGFLYSIGYLAGWIVALFVIAEPLRRLGKFTFADALDSRFNSRGIKLAAAISTLVVSIFYLIPQMVGAGVLVEPLLGIPYIWGVLIVACVVTTIVVTAGMVSTTWVQFIKGSLLVLLCTGLVFMILHRGLKAEPDSGKPQVLATVTKDGVATTLVNGKPQGHGPGEEDLRPVGSLSKLPGGVAETGPLGPFQYIATIQNSQVVRWKPKETPIAGGKAIEYAPAPIAGNKVMVPGLYFTGLVGTDFIKKLDFVSLMLALFAGTASLPHILIRYYTVKDAAAARKSTIVGIGTIGFFYILTLFLGLGAMTSGTLDVTNNNMSAPLLAKSFGELPFAVISAVAFTTVLGTVSGLIMAASGAVAHDLVTDVFKMKLDDHEKVRLGKVVAVVVGAIAMVLGLLFSRFNVTVLVGWAFNVAASANLPALIMLLFWKRTTKQGITASITVGLLSSVGWLLVSPACFKDLYKFPATVHGWVPFNNPGIFTIPLAFAVLIGVSLLTPKPRVAAPKPQAVGA
jgi:cation/acetate symporter